MLDPKLAATLLDRAEAASAHAYVPYSRFPVGAALLTRSGEVFEGANIENASYGLTSCAERTAAFAAVFAGHHEFAAVAVAAPNAPGTTPCGACRQVLNEFRPIGEPLIVVLRGDGGPEQVSLDDLLPRAFGPRNLAPGAPAEPETKPDR